MTNQHIGLWEEGRVKVISEGPYKLLILAERGDNTGE